MIALEVADLVLIASRALGLDTGQVLDLVDVAAAENALAEAQPGSESADPALRAAALARQRPLRRGNQQVALAAMLRFLAINGWDMDPDPPGPVAATVAGLTAGTAGTRDAAACWRRGRGPATSTTGAATTTARRRHRCDHDRRCRSLREPRTRCWLPAGRGCTPADTPTGTSRQSTWPWNRPGDWATTT
jgi:hypothetical protein